MASARWLILAAIFIGLAAVRRSGEPTCPETRTDLAADEASNREEFRAHFEFDVVHREYGNQQRKFDSTESSLGVITLVAVTLMAVYFPDPRTDLDRVLELALGSAAAVACVGFMFFRGYEPFTAIQFQRDHRGCPARGLLKFVDRMTELHRINQQAMETKRRCGWIGLSIVTIVEIVVSVSRWRGP